MEDIIEEIKWTDIAAYNLQPFLVFKSMLKCIEQLHPVHYYALK